MKLRSSPASPFGRKVRMAAIILGLDSRITVEAADTANPADSVRQQNPLGKIPALVLDDGLVLFDSRVILEYLDHLAGGGRLIPTAWPARVETLTLQAMADGVMDASILIVYEGRHRPAELHHQPWVDYQRGKVVRGLTAFAKQPADPARFDVGTITAACMLGYLDLRKQVDWRPEFPTLVAWLDQFRAKHPEFDATAPTA
jgi:glutathione S-transferase